MVAEVFGVIAPLLVLTGIGFVWARRGRPFPVEAVSLLVTNIGTPCLVLAALLKAEIDRAAMGTMALATGMALAAVMALAAGALLLFRLPLRSYLPALCFPNAGNAGLSLSLFAYGQAGLALGIVFFALNSLGNFIIGQSIYAGRSAWREVARSPMIYAVLIAVAGNLLRIEPPVWIMRSLQTAGGIAIPLMLMTLGVSLASLKVADLRTALLVAVLRLALGLIVGFGLAALLELEGVARGVFIIQCAMPVAVINYVFAERYRRDPTQVAGLVVVSTLLSFATLPLLLAVILGG